MTADFFRPRTASGVAAGLLPTADAAAVWAAYLTLDRTQWLSPEEIEAGQLAQVRSLLAHAIAEVPYYRDALGAEGIAAADVRTMDDFRRLPILARRTYQAEYPRMQARSLPAGSEPTVKIHTSGTSGIPIEVLQTDVVERWWQAFCLRDYEWARIDPRSSMAGIRAFASAGPHRGRVMDGVSLPSSVTLDPVIETGPFHAIDVNQEPHVQLAWLRRVAPAHIVSYASNMLALATLAADDGMGIPGLRTIHTTAEPLPPHVRARVGQVFGVPVTNVYSSNEVGYIASECPDAPGTYHVHAENVILEVLDAAGQPCRPGQTGRVVLTALHNLLTPLIRYDLLDDAEVGAACPCERGLPVLASVQGKRHVTLTLPNGKLKNSGDLVKSLPRVGGFHQFQMVVHGRDHVAIRVVPDRTFSSAQRDALVALVREYYEAPIAVDVVAMERLPLTAGGKVVDLVVR